MLPDLLGAALPCGTTGRLEDRKISMSNVSVADARSMILAVRAQTGRESCTSSDHTLRPSTRLLDGGGR